MTTIVTTPAAIRISPVGGEHPEQTARQAPSASRAELESDESLAQRACAGSLAAFGTLVDRYERRLIGFLSQRAGSAHAAEDLAQETFVRAWRRIETFDSERRFSTWLFTIAARLAADEHRKRKRERAGNEELGRRQGAAEAAADRASADQSQDVWGIARRILTPEQMEAMWLRYVMEMDIAGIAATLGRTRVGTRVLLFRARERLAATPELRNTLDEAAGSKHLSATLAAEVSS